MVGLLFVSWTVQKLITICFEGNYFVPRVTGSLFEYHIKENQAQMFMSEIGSVDIRAWSCWANSVLRSPSPSVLYHLMLSSQLVANAVVKMFRSCFTLKKISTSLTFQETVSRIGLLFQSTNAENLIKPKIYHSKCQLLGFLVSRP